jgi:hypothetical protein
MSRPESRWCATWKVICGSYGKKVEQTVIGLSISFSLDAESSFGTVFRRKPKRHRARSLKLPDDGI